MLPFKHQDLWYRKLVPSSHRRGKLSHIILCTTSGGNNRICKGIPISNSLRGEWALENVNSCSGDLKSMSDDFHCALLGDGVGGGGGGGGWIWSQWAMISTAPYWGMGGGAGIRSSVGMLTVPFRPLYERISLLPYILFLRDSHLTFFFSSIPVTLPVSKQ